VPCSRAREGGSASPSLGTLGRLAGRPWCPPSLLRQVLRVRKGKAANAAHVPIWPTAAPLVRNSPRGWAPRSLTTIRSAGRRAFGWAWPPKGAVTAVVPVRHFRLGERLRCCCAVSRGRSRLARWGRRLAMAMVTSRQPKRPCFVGSTRPNLRDGKSLRCPPSRRVPHKWSGRRPIRTWAAQRPFRYETRRTCLSSEGGHRRLCPSPLHASGGAMAPRESTKNQKKDDASAARAVWGPSFEGGASITLVPSAGETPGTRAIVTIASYSAVTGTSFCADCASWRVGGIDLCTLTKISTWTSHLLSSHRSPLQAHDFTYFELLRIEVISCRPLPGAISAVLAHRLIHRLVDEPDGPARSARVPPSDRIAGSISVSRLP
jgi:hypothetical protein